MVRIDSYIKEDVEVTFTVTPNKKIVDMGNKFTSAIKTLATLPVGIVPKLVYINENAHTDINSKRRRLLQVAG